MKKIFLGLALCVGFTTVQAQDDYENDWGTWLELGAQKNLGTSGFSVGADVELRTQSGLKQVDRLSVGVSGNYKLNKYLKFSLGYAFLDGYKAEKEKWKEGDDDTDWELRKRVSESYWAPRHRFYFDVAPTVKLGGWLRISLRERYQYTYMPSQEYTRESFYYREIDGEQTQYRSKSETMEVASNHMHVLRSRLKFELDKKRVDWSPYVSIEAHNNLSNNWHLRKLRASVGTDYKINRHHSVGAAYVFTRSNEDGDKDLFHAVSINYGFKF